MEQLFALDLFSGIGGLAIAISPYAKTIAYCENNRFCQALLLSRMRTGDIDRAPIWDDVRTLHQGHIKAKIDIITAGSPCMDFSSHGTQQGLDGKRTGLFYEVVRLADALRPKFIFLENVGGIVKNGLEQVTGEISRLGYDCRWTTLSAREVGCPQPRTRWFMLAHINRDGCHGWSSYRQNGYLHRNKQRVRSKGDKIGTKNKPDSWSLRPASTKGYDTATGESHKALSAWQVEPDILRMASGVPRQLDRIRALGNSVVPKQARLAFEILSGIKEWDTST